MSSVKSKLLMIVIPIITIALVSVSWINHNKAKSFLEESFEEKSMVQLNLLNEKLNGELKTHVEILKNIASSQDISKQNTKAQISYLKERLAEYKDYQMFFVSDKKGNVHTTEDKTAVIIDRDYFKEIMSGKESYISNPVKSKTSGIETVVFAVPIKNKGETIGLLATSFPVANLNKIVSEVKIGKTGYGFLTQNDGLIIGHPNNELVLKKNIKNMGIDELAGAYKKAVKGEKGIVRYTFENIDKYGFYAKVPQSEWLIFLTAPIKEASEQLNYLAILSAVTALVVLVAAIIIIFIFSTRLVKPLQKMSEVTTKVAAGDLTIAIDHKGSDEIGVLGSNFNAMVSKMQSLLNEIGIMSERVKTSSGILVHTSEETKQSAEQVSITISELASGTTDIVTSVTNVSSKVKAMNDTLGEIAVFAKEVSHSSDESKQSADSGKVYVEKAIEQITDANESVKSTAELIRRVDQQASEIGNVIAIITGIADQTNLLALNASIEAARAGEQGKGFAVVAEEVRKLANETTTSAEKISEIIRETQSGSHDAVKSIDVGIKIVEEGMSAVLKAGDSFIDIGENIIKVSDQNEKINSAIHNLEKISVGIGEDMESISAVTEQSSAGAEEVSAASEQQAASANQIASDAVSLAELSTQLKELLNQFKLKE